MHPTQRHPACFALVIALCCSIVVSKPGRAQSRNPLNAGSANRPNLILILADDLGYGDLGCYGQARIQTPHLDQMAQEGMRFTNFYAGSTVCAPSRCVLMTGYHTGHAWIRGNKRVDLRPDDLTVAEVLQQQGYATCLAGKWGLGQEGSDGVPNRQGFDHFFGYLDQRHAHNYYPTFLIRNEERVPLSNTVPNEGDAGQGVATVRNQYSHDLIMEEAAAFVDDFGSDGTRAGEPFFLYLALTVPHANNEAGPTGMEVPDLGAYANKPWPDAQKAHAAMISRMDADIGKLLQQLADQGLAENTIVFFSSDNGPHREGGNDPEFQNSSGPLRGIKRSLTEGGIRVPLIAWGPGQVAAGKTSDYVGGFQDFLPTLAELGQCPADRIPDDIDGLSFVAALSGAAAEQVQHESLYWAFYERGSGQALRSGKWKLIQQPIDSPSRLYDLSQDLGETENLAERNPDVVKALQQQMQEEYRANPHWQFPNSSPK